MQGFGPRTKLEPAVVIRVITVVITVDSSWQRGKTFVICSERDDRPGRQLRHGGAAANPAAFALEGLAGVLHRQISIFYWVSTP